MDKTVTDQPPIGKAISRDQAEEAVRQLIQWAGDDPDREGLRDTPGRLVRAFEEYFAGYEEEPVEYLQRTFEEVAGYDEVVLLREIPFVSHCEHHIAPIIGNASVAYLPQNRVVGISKLARVVQAYARRLQVQERLTAEIGDCIDKVLNPMGVAVVIVARHSCMTSRGVKTPDVDMVTSRMTGVFRDDEKTRREVMSLMGF